jgi:hypothetical protein
MPSLGSSHHKQKCTLIETFHGEVKLIIRLDDSPADLETLKFSNLKDCMEYVDKNKFQITVTHSGRKRNSEEMETLEEIKNSIMA